MAKDPYRYFRIEARELLDQLGSGVLDLEKGVAGTELPLRLLRYAHTLKGAARVVKQREIAELAHSLEGALAPHRDANVPVGRQSVDDFLGLLDAISARLAQLPTPEAAQAAAPEPEAWVPMMMRTDAAEVDGLLDGLSEIGSELAGLRHSAVSVERMRDLAASIVDQLAALRGGGLVGAGHETRIAKLRSVSEQMHSLVVAAERGLGAGVERVDRELRQARDTAERLRLSPAASLFSTLERTARDAAHSLGKRVSFETSGGDVRLDAQVLDTVQSALIQVVRNAVAHGIETEAERQISGKPPAGRLSLEVERRGYRVTFRCSDDGHGVDLDAVRHAVQRKGAPAQSTQQLSAADLLAVLLKGGITTSSNVTELAGRGIGLDVVREAMQQLGGDVVADTASGVGTTIELRVPVSLALLDVLTVEVDGQRAAIPLEAVRRTLRIAPHDVARSREGDAIVHEGALIPLVRLGLGTPRNGKRQSPPRTMPAVIISAAGATTAVSVDNLHGTETVVLRPLPALVPAEAIVSGTHLDADGNPRIVLDPAVLATTRAPQRAVATATPTPHPILIVDDSLTTRMLESSILESAGFAVELAASAEEALDMARRNHYALFLVDIEMPGMDGFGFIERTRADPALREVPCILVTSRDSQEDRRRGEAAGACAHIVKNEFDQVEFLERVSGLVHP